NSKFTQNKTLLTKIRLSSNGVILGSDFVDEDCHFSAVWSIFFALAFEQAYLAKPQAHLLLLLSSYGL
ncbi:hypothetical protein KKC_15274, partial [Listeria fleischmannii subsp. coloradonensis]